MNTLYIKGLSFGTIVRFCFISTSFGLYPLFIIFGVFGFFGFGTVRWNNEVLEGFSALGFSLIAGLLFCLIYALFFTLISTIAFFIHSKRNRYFELSYKEEQESQ